MIVYDSIFRKYGLSPTQQEIIKTVGKNKLILEIGSSTGYMTRAFLDNDCTVDVVEQDSRAAAKIPNGVRKKINESIEGKEAFKLLNADYQYIVMADVLEHLVFPDETLRNLAKLAGADTKLLVSLPNIACWAMRKQLFFKGDFQYQENGLLDKTHLHFYTVNTLPETLLNNGWKTERVVGTIIRLPLESLISRIPILNWIFKKTFYPALVNKYRNLSYYHFLVIAAPRR